MDGSSNTIITYFIEDESPEEEYVFDFIFDTLRIDGVKTHSPIDADICYLKDHLNDNLSSAKIIIKKDKSHIIWDDLINVALDIDITSKILPFDILNALTFFLTDRGNKGLDASSFDDHKRLIFEESFQFQNGIGAIPIVNRYIIFLIDLFEKRFEFKPGSFYPNGKKACVILSHDVDFPDKHESLNSFTFLPKKKNFTSLWRHYPRLLFLIKDYLFDKNKSEYWCFDELMEAEGNFGFKSSSYFSAINKDHEYANALDVPYTIEHKKFQKLFKIMNDNGFEIGMHTSYNAFLTQSHFDFEKNKLETAAKVDIIGLRHHYWHLGKDPQETLLMHEKAGFLYDSSLAFNDHIGFRYSSALPFFPYHSKLKRKINVLQIPVFCMDGHLFYKESMTAKKAVGKILKYLDILVENQGIGSIDWHIRTSYPKGEKYNEWGKAYLEVLEQLAVREDIWVTSAADFYEWWKSR